MAVLVLCLFMRGIRGGNGDWGPDPPENHKATGVLRNTGPNSLKNHKPTKPAFIVGPSSVRQRNAMAFHWRTDDG